MTDPFTLAHITDLHLGPLPWMGPRHWNLKRALGVANWLRKRRHLHTRQAFEAILHAVKALHPDHIAVTGDLANVGLPAELARALDTLRAIGPPERVSVVPGNHDIYCPLWRDAGTERWRAYAASDAAGGPDFPYVRRRGRLALVGVNSARPTPPGVAQGEAGAHQIAALGEMLAALRREDCCRVVMIHHPPLVGQTSPLRRLRDAAALTACLAAAGAELVIHGHDHRDEYNEIDTRDGRAVVIGVGSASMARARGHEPAARAALYVISRTPAGWAVRLTRLGLVSPEHEVRVIERRDIDLQRRVEAVR